MNIQSLTTLSRLVVLCLLIFTTTPAYAATVETGITLSSDNEAIYLGDSVILEVEAVGLLEPLDVSGLFKDADLLRETTGTRIAVIGGRVVEVKLRRMEFLPRREGLAFFGPLTGSTAQGEKNSNTLVINVLPPADTDWQPDKDDLKITLQLRLATTAPSAPATPINALTPYVGQHIIADIELRHRHPITDERLVLPAFKGFDVLSEYEERRTIDERSTDDRWRVIAWRFHLFAQYSGDIELSALQWQGTAIRSRTQRAAFERSTPVQILRVLAAAADTDWWLPSSRVSLRDDWSKDPRELSAGDDIIRTITLTADGVLASQLPEVVPLDSRALSSVLIKQTRNQQLNGEQLQASASFEYRMVAQSPIPVFLDTVRVAWYDTRSDMPQESIIPARRINVGLPDRADLLADIALNEHWWDPLSLKLQGFLSGFHYWGMTLILLSVASLLLWILEWRAHRQFSLGKTNKRQDGVLPGL